MTANIDELAKQYVVSRLDVVPKQPVLDQLRGRIGVYRGLEKAIINDYYNREGTMILDISPEFYTRFEEVTMQAAENMGRQKEYCTVLAQGRSR